MDNEVQIDLSAFEPQEHQWQQRGRALGCQCHVGRGVFLAQGINLVGVKDGKPVLKRD